MKNFILVISLCFCTGLASVVEAQIKTPAPSPSAKIMQTVGLTDIHVEYSRPGMKGRAIFGDLVPYGKVWRTGANAATKVTFSEDVQVEGKDLKAGSYAMFTTPGATSWDVHFFSHTTNSAGGYGEAEAAAVVTVTPQALPFAVESFMIAFDGLHDNGGIMSLVWNKTLVPVSIATHTTKQAMASIDKTLAGPTTGDYYNAGVYLGSQGKDLDKALSYIQKATHGDSPRFWQVRQEAEVLAKLGKKKEAVMAAKKSLELAEKAGNMDYVKINKDNIAKWGGM